MGCQKPIHRGGLSGCGFFLTIYYGVEYCGRQESHPYELFLYLNDIEHTRTKVRRPQTNGAVERLNQTIQDEFYSVAFRKKLYRTVEEVQEDLDTFLEYYRSTTSTCSTMM